MVSEAVRLLFTLHDCQHVQSDEIVHVNDASLHVLPFQRLGTRTRSL